jgi:hypothetical protein
LLITAADFQEKLRGAFKPETKASTPEEQEVLEEMQQQQNDESGAAERKPGEPAFLYVHRISQQEHHKAMAEAFANAHQRAEWLAKAAGAQLGDVRTLSAWSSSNPGEAQENMYAAIFAQMSGGGQRSGNDVVVAEATSPQPGPVSSHLTITGAFDMK